MNALNSHASARFATRDKDERLGVISHVSELLPQALARYLPDFDPNPVKEDPMLLLSRKPAETIVINESVVVKIVRISGGRVAVGIQAPADVSIRRGELAKSPQSEFAAFETAAADADLSLAIGR
jgi:carbon storage regulator